MSSTNEEISSRPDFEKPVSYFVKNDHRTAEVFFRHDIDFCCGANRSLVSACDEKGLAVSQVLSEIAAIRSGTIHSKTVDFANWDTEFLCMYIINVHHSYLRKAVPLACELLRKFTDGHVKKYPFLTGLLTMSDRLVNELILYVDEEEKNVLPYIMQIARVWSRRESYGLQLARAKKKRVTGHLTTASESVRSILENMRAVTDNYNIPANSCVTHRVAFSKLREIDADLQQLFFIENQILFPRCIEIENSLLSEG